MIIVVHSFRGGVGKTTILAQLANALCKKKSIAILDADLKSPGLHHFFPQVQIKKTLHDVLLNKTELKHAMYNIEKNVIYVPASTNYADIANLLLEKYNADSFTKILALLNNQAEILLIDTHPGIHEELLLTASTADKIILVTRPHGYADSEKKVSKEILKKLEKPVIHVQNMVQHNIDKTNSLTFRYDKNILQNKFSPAFTATINQLATLILNDL